MRRPSGVLRGLRVARGQHAFGGAGCPRSGGQHGDEDEVEERFFCKGDMIEETTFSLTKLVSS